MATLALWLKAHRDRLAEVSLEELTTREALRQEAAGPVKRFFDSLIRAISTSENARLEALLRNWVRMCSIPINGQAVGLLPVLGVFKRALWQVFQADPPSEEPLALGLAHKEEEAVSAGENSSIPVSAIAKGGTSEDKQPQRDLVRDIRRSTP